jgi:hypothetical protein
MLVPLLTAYPPPGYVESILTPGAAISTTEPKLLKQAKESSSSSVQVEKVTV